MAATICSVVVFADHIASMAVATVRASPVILSGTQPRTATWSNGSTRTRDDPQSAKPIGFAACIRAGRLAWQASSRSCRS